MEILSETKCTFPFDEPVDRVLHDVKEMAGVDTDECRRIVEAVYPVETDLDAEADTLTLSITKEYAESGMTVNKLF
jgi:hypothetical protein